MRGREAAAGGGELLSIFRFFYFHQIDDLTIPPHPPTAALTSFRRAIVVYTIADEYMSH